MIRLVRLDELSGDPGSRPFTLVDPRLRVRYLSGHIDGALHAPIKKAFGPDGRLLPNEELAGWLGRSGIDSDRPVVVYDQYDAQAGAMMVWLLSYLGHPDVGFVADRFEAWKAGGNELFYRPVAAEPATFALGVRPGLRSGWRDVQVAEGLRIVDVRSQEEFSGEQTLGDDRPGHIPKTANIPWLRFVNSDGDLLASGSDLHEVLTEAGLSQDERTILYCRSGPRAAVAWAALEQLGFDVSLYDASFSEWSSRPELPVEREASG